MERVRAFAITSLQLCGLTLGACGSPSARTADASAEDASVLACTATPPLRLTSSPADPPRVVWTGTEYGVVWNIADGEGAYVARIDEAGQIVATDLRVDDGSDIVAMPEIVWTGDGYGVTWNDGTRFARLDAAGNTLGPDALAAGAFEVSLQARPGLVWTGNGFAIAWRSIPDRTLWLTFLDPNGVKLGSDVMFMDVPSATSMPSLVWTGSEYGVSWADDRSGQSELYFARVDGSGTPIGEPLRVASGGSSSALFWSGELYAVAALTLPAGPSVESTQFARVDALGQEIGDEIVVESPAPFHNQTSNAPTLASSGAEFWLAWDAGGEIFVARIEPDGASVQSMQLPDGGSGDANYTGYPSIAFGSSGFALAWIHDGVAHVRTVSCD